MKLPLLFAALGLCLSTAACSKHECALDSDAKKQAFGALADMTAGAFNCSVEGKSPLIGANCEIGADKCVSTMTALHPAPATVKDTAAAYKAFLEKAQYKVEEKTVQSKFANGKDIEGVQLNGKNGDKDITVEVFPFGQDMVETRTYLAALK
ncbi:MAG: hypothetical protein R3B70_38120 [Polyangiaceae bacterium]